MPQYNYLTADSVLFWLVALIAAGIIFIGARFHRRASSAARLPSPTVTVCRL
jgi:hypothetical protein